MHSLRNKHVLIWMTSIVVLPWLPVSRYADVEAFESEEMGVDKEGCEKVIGSIPDGVDIPSEIAKPAKTRLILKKKK